MEYDSEFQKELISTFKDELEERLQVLTDGLLYLEKHDANDEQYTNTIDAIFRAAHNIKGAARGVGVQAVGDISHHMESLFTSIQNKQVPITKDIIDLCLEAVDSMRSSMVGFCENKPVSKDINNLISRLQLDKKTPTLQKKQEEKIEVKMNTKKPMVKNEYESIRVALSHIESVSALMEEIQVNKIALEDHFVDLVKLTMKAEQFSSNNDMFIELNNSIHQLRKNFRPKINELSTLSHSLQEEVRLLRLVPTAGLLRGFLRSTRDLAGTLNKKIQLDIKGDDAKMDKMILDSLKDPITHILRNAIDHGIESADKRLQSGKPETGHITIDVTEEGNQIFFTITDDGAGIDVKTIASIAQNKHIVTLTELQNMLDADILNLIFLPGFSTKEMITDISGRGVGLDVVKANLNALKGSVTVASILGKSTTFTLRVPLTLTSELGLMVSSGSEHFVIPMNGIERVFTLSLDAIVEIEASQAVLLEGHPVPLRFLAELLKFEKKEITNPNGMPIIILKNARRVMALLVDEIIGEREIVIKPLQPPASNVPCVIGGTLSGKGEVIIVLSASELIEAGFRSGKLSRVSIEDKAAKKESRTRILVVDDSITTRTLEKNILESHHYQVTLAVNGKEAWDILQKESFSLLITDVSMPIMDGFTLTERVKQSNHLRDLPVIIVTSLGSDAEKKRGVEVGANAYIVKNEFESAILLEVVAQLV